MMHTEGPYTTRHSGSDIPHNVAIVGPDGGILAEVFVDPFIPETNTYSEMAPVYDNAELFRSAPETAARLDRLLEVIGGIERLVNEQAEDQGLWFDAEHAPEAYLQQELRRLHGVIEAAIVATEARIPDGRG